ncbi:MAG: signal peptidase I [Candidatus Sungiibacteriota bacterium]
MQEPQEPIKETLTEESSRGGRFLGGAWEIVRILLISLAIVVPIRYFIVQPFVVRGASMEPNFTDQEYLVIDEASYYFRAPLRGEVIVFRYPRDTSEFFIKRIIGLPGEKITIQKGSVMIANSKYPEGFMLEEKYLDPALKTYPDIQKNLGQDEYFMLGDNRNASSDSRIWGVLPRKLIIGRAFLSAWPPATFGRIPDYAQQ